MGFFGNIGAEIPSIEHFRNPNNYFNIPINTLFRIGEKLFECVEGDGSLGCHGCAFNANSIYNKIYCKRMICRPDYMNAYKYVKR